MALDLLILFAILLAKAQKGGALFAPASAPPPLPTDPHGEQQRAAADAAARAKQAADEAAAARARGDAAAAAAKQAEAQHHAQQAQTAARAATTPPPWPAVPPGELPPYPGPGWGPASPVTGAMAARAWQLLPELWAKGEGTWKQEKTGTQWVVYKAAFTSPGRKGVVALTPRSARPALAPSSAPAAPTVAPTVTPAGEVVMPPLIVTPGATVPASASSAPPSMPTLRLTSPRMQGPSVVWLQQRLGLNTDGVYGSGSEAAVRHFQSTHGLVVDGVVGKNTWAALGVGQTAQAA